MRLICFPDAGGAPELFRKWSAVECETLQVVPCGLPGQGRRLFERACLEWDALVEDVYLRLEKALQDPHAFYGHCFGAQLAYEMTRRVARQLPGRTRHLFVAGCRSPDSEYLGPVRRHLDDLEFAQAMRDTGDSPIEVLDNQRLLDLLMPGIRAYSRLCEVWMGSDETQLEVPLTAFCGSADVTDGRESMQRWRRYTRGDFELIELPGGHRFIDLQWERVSELVKTRLEAAPYA
jgi:medium-chain acyl-[acyl-carrier-protein] hydrolase